MARILVIDDDPQVRNLMRQILERNSHEVIEACNGIEGIAIYEENPTDLVIADLIMPGKDGVMAIQHLIGQFPLAKVIAVSGGVTGNAAWLPIAKKVGAKRVIKKPFTKEQFMEAVSDTLASNL